MITKVKFLIHKQTNELFAFFYEELYGEKKDVYMSYAHIGQHSACHIDYTDYCRLATELQYTQLLNELKGLGYELEVYEEVGSIEFPHAKILNELKQIIIENFINYYTTDEAERASMFDSVKDYILEDHVQEILQGLNLTEDNLGVHTSCQNCGSSTNL